MPVRRAAARARRRRGSPAPGATRSRALRSLEDLGRAIAVLQAHLVCTRRPSRAVAEVDEEVAVDLHAAVRAAVDAQQPGAETRVELVVPGRVERIRDVQPAAVE